MAARANAGGSRTGTVAGILDQAPRMPIILIDDILTDGPAVRDIPVQQPHVAMLTEVLDLCPPVVVQAHSLRLIDGRHRLEAARTLNRTHIPCEVIEVDDDRVLSERIQRNATHGLALTAAERRRAAAALLAQHPDWSDRRIATCVGVAHTTVARVRRECHGGATLHLDTPSRLGSDGKRYPATEALTKARNRAQSMLRNEPHLSDRAIGRLVGLSPSTIGALRRKAASEPVADPRSATAEHPDSESRTLTRWRSARAAVGSCLAWATNLARALMRWMRRTGN